MVRLNPFRNWFAAAGVPPDPVWDLVDAGQFEAARRLHHEQDRAYLHTEWLFLARDSDMLCGLGRFEDATQAIREADRLVSEEVPGLRLLSNVAVV